MKRTYKTPAFRLIKAAPKMNVLLTISTENLGKEAKSGTVGFGHDTDDDWEDDEY